MNERLMLRVGMLSSGFNYQLSSSCTLYTLKEGVKKSDFFCLL